MKPTKFNYEITLRAGEYQSIKIGGEWSCETYPTTEEIVNLDAELRASVSVVLARRKNEGPAPSTETPSTATPSASDEAEDKRELVDTDSAKLQAIIRKIESGTTEDVVRKFFKFTEKAEQVIQLSLMLNKKD